MGKKLNVINNRVNALNFTLQPPEWIRLTPPHQGYSNAGPSLLSENPHTKSTKDTKESEPDWRFLFCPLREEFGLRPCIARNAEAPSLFQNIPVHQISIVLGPASGG